jgi:hypothetical protein
MINMSDSSMAHPCRVKLSNNDDAGPAPGAGERVTHPTMRERAFSMSFLLKKSSGLTRSTG